MHKVLIVDDQKAIRDLLRELLLEQDCESRLADGIPEAMRALHRESFDAVIVDIFLGKDGGSGLDLLPLIRNTQPFAPAIVISGLAEREDVITALKAGAYDLLCKPFNLPEVQKAVANAIEKKVMAEENARLVAQLRLERDLLEERVTEATRDLANKVQTLQTLNEQLSLIFDMSQARSIDAPTQSILEHIISLLGKTIQFKGAFCVVFDLRAKEFSLQHSNTKNAEAMAGEVRQMLLNHYAELAYATENTGGAHKDVSLKAAMAKASPSVWPGQGHSLALPLFVPQTLLGVFGVVDITQPTNLSQAEERVIGFALSNFLAALEERSFLNRTTQLASFGELVTEIAHDLRHPMTSMRGVVKILNDKWDEEEKRTLCLHKIKTDLSRMESLTSELVNFYKPRDMNMAQVDLHDLVDKAIEVSQFLLEQKKTSVARHYGANPSTILGLSRNLVEAFVNLITNGIQAMEPEGTMTFATGTDFTVEKQQWLRQSGRSPEHYLWLSISDTGAGIHPDDLDKIWQRFYTTKSQGTGLGLPAVNRLVRKNLGTISVESEEGRGSTFTIYLPRG